MAPLNALLDWLDSRTGWRTGRATLLEEPIPAGVGWWFVTGSILLLLLGVQLITGVVLALYYVPSPEHAYDSIRYIMDRVAFGRVVRGLHFFGASFIVVAAVIHMLRVVALGSYKKPREVTWMTGVVLLLVILAFALSGYLLPWDQKAYWATTVTINIARSGPMGEFVAGLMKGGDTLGSLTLLRWYAAHVFLLPASLIVFVLAHLFLMRRHGISGALRPVAGEPKPFYPYHALKDTIAGAAVFALLLTFAITMPTPLDQVADPSDASYVPRPEWYFLSLFQLLKYFPGPLEPLATMVIPGLIVGLLLLLPFIDRRPDRHFLKRPLVTAGFGIIGIGIIVLTYLGNKDTPAHANPSVWGPLPIAGHEFARDARCVTCHVAGGAASPIDTLRLRKDPEWLISHVRDPQVIAPGLREPPPGGMNEGQARSIASYLRKVRVGVTEPEMPAEKRLAALVIGRHCASCHMVDGEGGSVGPDLTRVGARHDAAWLHDWITQPDAVDPAASMPAFGEALGSAEMAAIVKYLSEKR
ncbi:MAG TPA: cytochrome b N-terminal domain-containing protein [Vicinamibacterales bacterium]|nr:cytochrome b N-terminal domain-containing protein [Vicinamibacterales bacterium]